MKLLTRRELAALSDLPGQRGPVHPMSIVKWDREGMPVAERGRKGRPSLYDEVVVRAWLSAREEASRAPGAPLDVAQERAKKEHFQALLAEQTLKIRARELITWAEAEQVANVLRDENRTEWITLPTEAARLARAATLGGEVAIERELKEIAYEKLRRLAGQPVASPVKGRKERVA